MTGPTVVDYSWARPDPKCLRGEGYVGVMRYLSWDRTGKNLDRAEVKRLHDAGLWIGLNWEGAGNWSEFSTGAIGGTRAGLEAARQAKALDAPGSVPVFVSADYGAPRTHWSTIAAWLAAFRTASGRRIGFYGQGDLADHLLDSKAIEWIWQTNATGWGGVSKRAVLVQKMWTKVCGADADPNVLIGNPADWAWLPNQSEEDDMTPAQEKKLDEALAAATDASREASQANARAVSTQIALAALTVSDAYRRLLGREASQSELDGWAAKMNPAQKTPWSVEKVVDYIATSDEAKNRPSA